jgi:hypothetical protein
VESVRPPLWFSGQSSWLRIQRSGFGSRSYQIFWEVVGLERGPLSLVSTIEELLERKKNSSSGLESRECGHGDPLHWPRRTIYPQKLELTSPASCGRSVGRYRSLADSSHWVCFVCLWSPSSRRGFFVCCYMPLVQVLACCSFVLRWSVD